MVSPSIIPLDKYKVSAFSLLEESFLTVTSGIRTSSIYDNQARVTTHEVVLKKWSNFLVIGRPITTSTNPLKSLERIIEDINL